MNSKITIGITDCGKWTNYEKWISQNDPAIDIIKLSWRDNNIADILKCDGIVLSGGEDVHPRFYNKPDYYALLDPKDVIEQRDEFELRVIDAAMQQQQPVLGICRGLQITNVYFKGTLIPDIPTVGKLGHAMIQGVDEAHMVKVEEDTLFKKIVNTGEGIVNSAHHQAADKVSDVLKTNAVSSDGVIEGLEWKEPEGKSFLLLVQWHPERMKDAAASVFSKNIRTTFLQKAKDFSSKK